MDVVVKGRNVEVPVHYRVHVADKLHKIERYDHKIIEVNVELLHERNPRQHDNCQRVEITCVSRGPVVRAEACAGDFYAALDKAIDKLDTRLRRAADRRRIHRGRHAPVSVATATAALAYVESDFTPPTGPHGGLAVAERDQANESELAAESSFSTSQRMTDQTDDEVAQVDDQPWHIARTKEHPNEPMTVDDALFQMELVGHDFYLFLDKGSGQPSVVYRRHKGYDYGVISLAVA